MSMLKDRGAFTVETVGAMMALAMFVAVVLQVALVLNAYLMASHATREGVRAAALGEQTTVVRYIVANAAGLDPHTADIEISPEQRTAGELVTVTLSAEVQRMPVLEAILPTLTVSTHSTARAEVSYGL